MRMLGMLAAIAVLASCDDSSTPDEVPLDCEQAYHPRCEHPIDRIMIPRLRAANIPIEIGPLGETCRRLYIDLTDRGPTPTERERCEADFEGTVTTLLASREHVDLRRGWWRERMRLEFNKISTLDVVDLDARIAALERGQLAYVDFVTAIASHPGFYGLHQGDDWFGTLIPLFLGRPAYQNELAGLRPLSRMWQLTDFYIEGGIWWKSYRQAIDGGSTDAEARTYANMLALNAGRSHFAFNGCLCTPSESIGHCASATLGTRIDITPFCPNPADIGARENARRVIAVQPGQRDDCFGGGNRPECADRVTIDFAGQFAPWEPMAQIAPVIAADLAEIGAAFGAKRELWEAAANRELEHLLGWWQTTFKHPDSDVPAVRELLAARLRDGASLRDVRALIATSLLYQLPAEPPDTVDDPEQLPAWAMGPSKVLAGEGWLLTAAQAVGETASRCDPRWVLRGGIDFTIVDDRYYTHEPGSLDALFVDPIFSIGAMLAVGGCNADDQRPTRSNIGLTYAQAVLARRLCAYGRGVLPPAWSGDLGAAADHLENQILARASADRATLVADMQACLAAPGGCGNPEAAARWMCRRMLDSAEFATY